MRLLILIALIFLAYRAFKSWFHHNVSLQPPAGGNSDRVVEDEMIKDPVCNVYFPKRDGLHLNVNGQDIYFCSEQCRDRYVASGVTNKSESAT